MIISIVPEGTKVNKGDLVCQLDKKELEEKITAKEVVINTAEANMLQAKENLEIQKIVNERDKSTAETAYQLALLDKEKYENGEYRQLVNTLEGSIKLKQEEKTRAEQSLEFSKRMAKKGYRSQSELEAEQLSFNKAVIEVSVEQEKLVVLKNYEYRRKIAELNANAKDLELDLERVNKKADSAIVSMQSVYNTAMQNLEAQNKEMADLKSYLANTTLYAPQNGEVVYANPSSSSSYRSSEVLIAEGLSVRERQQIVKIPDLEHVKVESRIHESVIGRVSLGQPAVIRIISFPDEIFNGVISEVSSVPMSGSFPNTDIKEYRVCVALTDEPEKVRRLRPGLTAEFEIIVDNRGDILQIPVQGIINIGSDYFCYMLDPEGNPLRKKLKVGDTNDTSVEIIEGITVGDQIILNPRSSFPKEISMLEEEYTNKADQKQESEARELAKKVDVKKLAQESVGVEPATDAVSRFQSMDINKDQKLTVDELPPPMANAFVRMDTNLDGGVDLEEFKTAAARMKNGNRTGGGPPSERSGERSGGDKANLQRAPQAGGRASSPANP